MPLRSSAVDTPFRRRSSPEFAGAAGRFRGSPMQALGLHVGGDMTTSLLIVDDDDRVRRSLRAALADDDLDVRVAQDATSALAAITRKTPDVVLSDVRMPDMSGLELSELPSGRMPEAAVILMTAFDDLDTLVAAMKPLARLRRRRLKNVLDH